MSRIIKKIVIFLFLSIALVDCEKYNANNVKKQQLNKESENIEKTINKISYYEPLKIVDDLLQAPSQNLNIAIVAPMSGKYADIGNMMVEGAMLTIGRSKYNDTSLIKVYDIGELIDENWKENKEVQKLIKDNNDVVIGSFFIDTTKKLLSVLPNDKLFISFVNDEELAKNYPNLVVSSMSDGYKINSLFQYLKDTRRQFLSLILPATKKGYIVEKLFRGLAKRYGIVIIGSQFYQEGSGVSILASVRGVNKSYTATYIVDDGGHFKTETYKKYKAKKQSNNQENFTKVVETNAIYVEANENDLITILDGFEKLGILNKNVQIVSSAIVNPSDSAISRFDNIYYIGYNYNFINYFNDQFRHYFKHNPNYVTYMTYDTLTMLYYIANEGKMLPRKLYDEEGFRGVLDEFRFSREGNIERRLGIYKIQNNSMSRVFIPSDYLLFNTIKNSIYDNGFDSNKKENKNTFKKQQNKVSKKK